MLPKPLLALGLIPLLAACGEAGGAVRSAPVATTAPTPIRTPVRRSPPPVRAIALPGTEGVIGASRADLVRSFGPARLDVWEGDARKLQFGGTACVLDVYLYPKSAGAEPQATYVDARRPSDGKDVDRAACITALRKQ
jgi:hypothetical protein